MSNAAIRRPAPAPAQTTVKPPRALYPDARSTSLRRFRSQFRVRGWLMKKILLALAVGVAVASSAAAEGVREVGVGVIAGDPIGGTAKLWLDQNVAVDAGVGFSGDAVFWGDVLYHMYNLLPQPQDGKLSVYLGAGPRLETRRDAEFGVRTIGGVAWRLSRQPLEFFAEAGPVFRVTQGGGVGADGGIGLRVYLGSK